MDETRDQASSIGALDRSLFEAKLSLPSRRQGTVSRGPLIRTGRASDRRVVAVTAPAGYGKSTFLAEWAHAEERPVAWVSLDSFDDDPAALLFTLASAYERVDTDPRLIADMRGFGVSALGRAAPRLAAAFGAAPEPFVLMLDDLHALRSPACHDVLSVVVASIPQGSQLVAASRVEQPHVPRLRVSDEVLEFGVDDLALDDGGARQIFADAQVELTSEQRAEVLERTEGWPAGLYLAALIARENQAEVATITGADRYVADYLYRESMANQPEDVQRFLRRTAVVDQLYGPLCDALLESTGGEAWLRSLEATSLFVIPMDRQRRWYRYHALYREFLLGELQRTEPEIVPKLHLRAADWYESSGSPQLAVDHLLHTDERDRCVQLVTTLVLPTYSVGQISTVQQWLTTLGDASIESYPPLAVLAGWVAVLTGHTMDAERWAALAGASSWEQTPLDGTASFASAQAMLRAVMCAEGPDAMKNDAELAVGEEPAWSLWRDSALLLLAEADVLTGDLEGASALFAESAALGTRLGNTDTVVAGGSELAMLLMDHSRWDEAAGSLAPALAAIDEYRMDDYVVSALAFAAAARLALHRGDLHDTNRQLTRAMRTRPTCTYVMPWLAVRLRLQLAKVYLALSDATTAHHLMREIDDILHPQTGASVGSPRMPMSSAERSCPWNRPRPRPDHRSVRPSSGSFRISRRISRCRRSPVVSFVSHNTVRSQVGSIYRKFGVSSRSEAVKHATEVGLLGRLRVEGSLRRLAGQRLVDVVPERDGDLRCRGHDARRVVGDDHLEGRRRTPGRRARRGTGRGGRGGGRSGPRRRREDHAVCPGFSSRNEPITSASSGEVQKHSIASRGVQTIGSPRVLNEVLTSTGTPVRARNARIRS